ncbi:MAG: porin family protein [Bacteroidaceae bacterium]|nr:porin family protein [Bacteroidaceae bacterium]
MKKIFLTLMVMVAAVAANAQVWVGGSLGFWSNGDAEGNDTKTQFTIAPEVGYDLSEDWSIAIGLGYGMQKPDQGEDLTTLTVNPYARYNFVKAGALKLFLDGGFEVGSIDDGNDSYTAWNVGIKPGVAYSLNEKFSLVAHFGFLGYQDCDDEISEAVQKGFGFDFSNNLTFGFYYAF